MRANVILWWFLSIFFLILAVIYTGWNYIAHPGLEFANRIEWVGSTAMLFSAAMAAMVGFYLGKTHKSQGGEIPADTLSADIDDADPELGEFSPWSWWPLVLAGSASIFVIGMSVGYWIAPIGLGLFIVAIVGWVFEYYRGNFAR